MNYKIFFGFFLSMFSAISVFPVTNYEEVFLQANNAYKEGNFAKAFDLYKSIPNAASEINYNLGNCAYKLGQSGYALLYWRRAERDCALFSRGELLENISLLKNQLANPTQIHNGKLFDQLSYLRAYTFSVIKATPLFVVQFLFLAIWFFLFLYVRFLFKKKRRFLIALLFIVISLLGTLLVIKYSLYYRHHGVVVAKKAVLLSGPGKSFQELGGLSEAAEVLIQKESDDFYKVKFGRQGGWVNQKEIEKI
jgi:hypothetical protein